MNVSEYMRTAKSQMVTPLVTIWTANKKFGGAVLGSGLEGGGAVFGFGHYILFLCAVFTMVMR